MAILFGSPQAQAVLKADKRKAWLESKPEREFTAEIATEGVIYVTVMARTEEEARDRIRDGHDSVGYSDHMILFENKADNIQEVDEIAQEM